MRAGLLPCLIACAIATTSGVALADSTAQATSSSSPTREVVPIHVIGFVAGDQFEHAEALTRAIKKAIEQSTNQRLASGDYSLEVLTAALGCSERPDTACLKRIAGKIAARRFLWGMLTVEGTRVDVELQLYGEDSIEKRTKFSYPATQKDDAALLGVAADAVSRLTEPLRFRVAVKSNESSGTVLIDGKESGHLSGGEAIVEAEAGDHRFQLASAAKRVVAEGTARVPSAEGAKVTLERKAAPVSSAGTSRLHVRPQTNTSPGASSELFSDAPKPNSQRTWGYITTGAGGVLLAGGVGAAAWLYSLNHQNDFQSYRNGISPNEDACTEADKNRQVPGAMAASEVRSLCKRASVLEVAEVVLLSTGVVAVGTGITLLLTSRPSARAAAARVEPRVSLGRERTELGVAIRF